MAKGSAATQDATPIDADTVRSTIARVSETRAVLPQYQDLVNLQQLLRGHLRLLLPLAQARANRLNRGSTLWYQRQTTIDRARLALDEGMGDGLRSAALHVQELSRHCEFLLNSHCEDGE